MVTSIGKQFVATVAVFAVLTFTIPASGQEPKSSAGDSIVRVEPDGKGFHWPYLLYVPEKLRGGDAAVSRTLLVLPNNTGSPNDDPAFHE